MDEAKLLDMYDAGIPVEEIGKKFGIKPNGIYYYLKKIGREVNRRQRKYDCNDNLFRESTEKGLYWLGFCVADAHAQGNEVQLQLARKDREAIEGFKKALETDHPIYDYWERLFPVSKIYVTSDQLAADLLAFNVKKLMEMPAATVHHFIRGLFDGDGSVTCRDYVYDGVTAYHRKVTILGEKLLLQVIQSMSVRLAGTTPGSIRKVRGIHEWSLAGAGNVKDFRDWLYKDATIFLVRKKNAFRLLDRDIRSRSAA